MIDQDSADILEKMLTDASAWPLWGADPASASGFTGTAGGYAQIGQYGSSMRDLALWIALREGDRDRLQSAITWDAERDYHFDPLPSRIAGAYSDLLFGDDPEFKAADEADQEQLDEMIEENDLPSELRRWVDECVSEGEVWWRIYVDKDISEYPIVASASRLDTYPLFIGRKIKAVAFTEVLGTQTIMLEGTSSMQVYRHVEIQAEGYVRNLLFKGGVANLGQSVPLTDLPDTKDLPRDWPHDLPMMLAGRIPNKLGRDWRLGVSEYQGIKDLLLDLNEAHTIMSENARLTSKARMIVPASALDENGKFDAGQDVIVADSLDESLDDKGKGPYAVLEYKFQADQLLRHMDNLVSVALTRVGLAEQFIGGSKSGQGQAFTGTALRTRLIPTTLAAAGKGRHWDDGVPKMMVGMQMVAALPTEELGCGQTWRKADEKPSMVRSTVLPEDENEETQRHVMAVQGEIESIYQAVKQMHPDWSEDDINEEIDRIKADRAPGGLFDTTSPTDPQPKPGEPGYTPADKSADAVAGARQPGAGRGRDGQSPGTRPPVVPGGGPK